MHPTLKANYRGFEDQDVPLEPFLEALSKDKNNTGAGSVTLILPDATGRVTKSRHDNDAAFASICQAYFERERLRA